MWPPGGTRCCIHTAGAPLQPGDMTEALVAAALDGAALVFFDGRLTEAALVLATAAKVGACCSRLHTLTVVRPWRKRAGCCR